MSDDNVMSEQNMREDDRSKKAMRKSFKYTDSFEEFLVSCNEFLRKYLEKKN